MHITARCVKSPERIRSARSYTKKYGLSKIDFGIHGFLTTRNKAALADFLRLGAGQSLGVNGNGRSVFRNANKQPNARNRPIVVSLRVRGCVAEASVAYGYDNVTGSVNCWRASREFRVRSPSTCFWGRPRRDLWRGNASIWIGLRRRHQSPWPRFATARRLR